MNHDEGYSFGLGVFETMSVTNGRCIMLNDHMDRLFHGLDTLGIASDFNPEMISDAVCDGHLDGRVLKVEVSEKNIIFSDRCNPYTENERSRGFALNISSVRRNESSPLTYIKSLGYGDSILEKRKSKHNGFDEPLFLNSRREICEGATTNIFFVRNGKMYTPKQECGLLPGTVRKFLMNNFGAEETAVYPEDIPQYSECFVSNSVLGIMPVNNIDNYMFESRKTADSIYKAYCDAVANGL